MVPVIQSQPDQNVHERKELRRVNMEWSSTRSTQLTWPGGKKRLTRAGKGGQRAHPALNRHAFTR